MSTCDQIIFCVALLCVSVGFYGMGYLWGWKNCDSEKQAQMKSLNSLVRAAKDCGSKLRVEIQRRSIEPHAEYENLISEAANHKWR